MANSPPRRGCFGRSIVTVVLVLIVAVVICGGLAYVIVGPAISTAFNSVAAPISANNDFMNALIAKDYTKAYGLIHSTQQNSFGGSPQGMQKVFSAKGWAPSSYTFANIQVGTDAIANGSAVFNGATQYVYISLRKDGDAWKILGLDINGNAPTATPSS